MSDDSWAFSPLDSWRPADAAPKDGHPFLAINDMIKVFVCHWDFGNRHFVDAQGQHISCEWPSMVGWKPLGRLPAIGANEADTRRVNGWPPVTKITRQEVKDRVVAILKYHFNENTVKDITADALTWEDLGAESLDYIDLMFNIEDEFGIELEDDHCFHSETTLAALIDVIGSRLKGYDSETPVVEKALQESVCANP